MKIKCPDCRTSYDIKADALGSEGRSVKCARCGNRWFVSPDDGVEEDDVLPEIEDTPASDETAWAEDAASEEDFGASDDSGFEDAPAPASPAEDMSAFANDAAEDAASAEDGDEEDPASIQGSAIRPKVNVNPDKFKKKPFKSFGRFLGLINYGRIGSVTVLIASVLVCVVLVSMRSTIVKQAPDLASLFEMIGMEVNLRGLEFSDLRTFSDMQEGKKVLVVEGTIRNILDKSNQLPAIRLSLRGTDAREVYAWTFEPRTKVLNQRDETRFRTMLTDPPEGITDLQIWFIDRDKRQLATE